VNNLIILKELQVVYGTFKKRDVGLSFIYLFIYYYYFKRVFLGEEGRMG
jgi:hypothetical protein